MNFDETLFSAFFAKIENSNDGENLPKILNGGRKNGEDRHPNGEELSEIFEGVGKLTCPTLSLCMYGGRVRMER